MERHGRRKIPIDKKQIKNKFQIQITNDQNSGGCGFEIWKLEFGILNLAIKKIGA
jgi:hypothetical protein